jgi:hypothetical protein
LKKKNIFLSEWLRMTPNIETGARIQTRLRNTELDNLPYIPAKHDPGI